MTRKESLRMQLIVEEWKPVPINPSYKASNLGNIIGAKNKLMKHASNISINCKYYFWDEIILSAFGIDYDFYTDELIYEDGDRSNKSLYNLIVRPLKPDDGKEWRDVVGWEGIYQVSNKGDIIRLPSLIRHPRGFDMKIKGQTMKFNLDADGYFRVGLTCQGRKNESRGVHQLVARAFIPNPENKPQINHKDGNKQNNNVENLEWVTPSENTKHAVDTGLISKEVFIKTGQISREKWSKPVRCIQTGQIFDCIQDAERELGLYPTAINYAMNQSKKHSVKGLSFEFVDKNAVNR